MTTEPDLAPDLDRALGHLPDVPATTYLAAARRARRRRRAVAGLAAAAVLAVGVTAATAWPDGPERTPVASAGTEPTGSLAPVPVTGPGVAGVDAFTTEGIPTWAEEHGRHGPVAVAPDGRMWVAPDATVLRTVVDPLTPTEGTPRSYAVEAQFKGEVVWALAPLVMDDPGRWTENFDVWVEEQVASAEGGPGVGARMVHFAGPHTEALEAGPQAELVRQIEDVELPKSHVQHPRASVAEVRWRGDTWYVLAVGPRRDEPYYFAYQQSVVGTDLEVSSPGWGGPRERPRRDLRRVRHRAPDPAAPDRVRRVPRPRPAEDVLQEAFIKLYLSWSKVRRRGVEEAYARRIIVNADIDDRRRPWRRHRSRATDDQLALLPAPAPFPLEERTELLEALHRLPAMQRRTVVLRHLAGLSVEETATELGIGVGTVKSHTSRGLEALRGQLAERSPTA